MWKRTGRKCEEENEEERDPVTAASLRPCSSSPWARASCALSMGPSEPLLIHRHLSGPAAGWDPLWDLAVKPPCSAPRQAKSRLGGLEGCQPVRLE